jgi:hypothetical protein
MGRRVIEIDGLIQLLCAKWVKIPAILFSWKILLNRFLTEKYQNNPPGM